MIQPNDIRLAVDSGDVALGARQVIRSIESNSAKLVVIASGNKADTINDIKYITGISGIKLEVFTGNSMELGSVCGKPYSVSVLAVIDPGNSNILNAPENNTSISAKSKEEEAEISEEEPEEEAIQADSEDQEKSVAAEEESDEAQEINEQSD